MRKDYWKFVEWIWSKRDQPYFFRTTTVIEQNREQDQTLPSPALEPIEATELFDFLAEKELVTEKEIQGEKVFRINKIEAHKWNELIAELKTPDWKRSWIWKKTCSSSFWIITMIIAGGVGATVKESSEHLLKKYVFKDSKQDSPKNSTPNNNHTLPDKPKEGTKEIIVPATPKERSNPIK